MEWSQVYETFTILKGTRFTSDRPFSKRRTRRLLRAHKFWTIRFPKAQKYVREEFERRLKATVFTFEEDNG